MRIKFLQLTTFLILFLLFFSYRLAFREDFRALEMLQIVLNSILDLVVSVSLFKVLKVLIAKIEFVKNQFFSLIFKSILVVLVYYLFVKALQLMHYAVLSYTVGLSDQFRALFDRTAYQVFDSYSVLAFGVVILLASDYYKSWLSLKEVKELVEKEKISAELNYLKSQIDPHFIFNTLNNIHFLIDEQNENARKLIREFCDLLRYQLYETGMEKVSISGEILYLKNYIKIQRIRKEDGFTVEFRDNLKQDFEIAPLLLIVLMENAFKYSGQGEEDFIKVDVFVNKANVFNFICINSLMPDYKPENREFGGLGLQNVRKRLDLIYGNKAGLTTDIRNHQFEAVLTIDLNE
ncbi:MAG: histidine kinase [Flavobacteriales bacterium]|nr:histidine kinase [Flavobacteriales bacterium]